MMKSVTLLRFRLMKAPFNGAAEAKHVEAMSCFVLCVCPSHLSDSYSDSMEAVCC